MVSQDKHHPHQVSASGTFLGVFQPSHFTEGGGPGGGLEIPMGDVEDWLNSTITDPTAEAADEFVKAAAAAKQAVSSAITATVGMGLLVGGGVVHGALGWMGNAFGQIAGGKKVVSHVIHPSQKLIEARLQVWEQYIGQQVQTAASNQVELHKALNVLGKIPNLETVTHTIKAELAVYDSLIFALDQTVFDHTGSHRQKVLGLTGKVDRLFGDVHTIQQAVDNLQLEIGSGGKVNLKPIEDQIRALQHSIDKLHTVTAHLQTEITTVTDQQTTIEHEFETMGGRITHLHHEYETISQRLRKLESKPTVKGGLSAEQAKHLKHAYGFSLSMAPLLALLPLSSSRVRNLVKLSDDPCQCPTTGGIPNPLIAALVADFAMKDGV